MAQTEEATQIFTDLGLTYVQAKLYLTLAKFGAIGGDVKRICRESGVVRQDIYRVMPTLQKLGLAEKIIAKPTVYRGIPLEKGFSMLLSRKTSEYSELKKKAKMAFDKIAAASTETDAPQQSTEFIITSERSLFLAKVKEDIERTKANIDIVYSKERMSLITFHAAEQIEKAMKRGVKVRALTSKIEGKTLDRNIQALEKNPSFELRLAEYIAVGLIIFDKTEVNVRIANTIVPSLWTNNQNVAKLAEAYFDDLWEKAEPT
jgi:sugar-specific transcriptional regulator TrmB